MTVIIKNENSKQINIPGRYSNDGHHWEWELQTNKTSRHITVMTAGERECA